MTTLREAENVWAKGHRWDIAFVTSKFDVVDLPGYVGAGLHSKLITRCPTATVGYAARQTRRWHFLMEPGALSKDDVERLGGLVHSGPNDWIAASPTRTEDLGRVGWIVDPVTSNWTPCSKQVVQNKLGANQGITNTIATVTDGLG